MGRTEDLKGRGGRLRFTRSLRFRLTACLVLAVLGVVGIGTAVDYAREYRAHIEGLLGSLEEQARGLMVARARIRGEAEFAQHVNDFCAQMNEHISPGHHVLMLDRSGQVRVRAHHHSGQEVEEALLSADPEEKVVSLNGHSLAQVRLTDQDGSTFILAQYLDHMEGILRGQLISRALTGGAVAVAIAGLIYLVINRWVLKPFAGLAAAAKAWSERDFAARSEPTGPADMRMLSGEFNAMAAQLEKHERSRSAELNKAKQIQVNLLPHALPAVEDLAVAAEYRPVEHVAGDLYDVFELPGSRTAFAVLDVAGHGISAALLTGVVKMALHRRFYERTDPSEAMEQVNRDLLACLSDGQFVTACVGVWDPQEATWSYCAAGHPGGLLLSAGRLRALEPTGPLLGLLPEATWTSRILHLRPGERLFLYTDGVVDAGAPYDRLGESGMEQLLRGGDGSLCEQLERVMNAVAGRRAGLLGDDATMLALEVLSAPAGTDRRT